MTSRSYRLFGPRNRGRRHSLRDGGRVPVLGLSPATAGPSISAPPVSPTSTESIAYSLLAGDASSHRKTSNSYLRGRGEGKPPTRCESRARCPTDRDRRARAGAPRAALTQDAPPPARRVHSARARGRAGLGDRTVRPRRRRRGALGVWSVVAWNTEAEDGARSVHQRP